MQVAWHVHRFVYRATRGRLGQSSAGHRNLLIRTRGRRTGERRETLVWFVDDGPTFLVVASNAGSDRHPAWYFNLDATLEAEVRVGDAWRRVTAHRLTGDELDAAWRRIDAVNPSYRRYRATVRRAIPVLRLTPVT